MTAVMAFLPAARGRHRHSNTVKYHIMIDGVCACSEATKLGADTAFEVENVPVKRRCRKLGCAAEWEKLTTSARVQRLLGGDHSFGCGGTHHGIGSKTCPKHRHHHHDDFCMPPKDSELQAAGLDRATFAMRSRA